MTFLLNQYALAKEKRAEKYKKKRNVNDYFVYKFVDNNNQIIYIGKTIRLQARMVEHFITDSHLTDECYDNVKYVFYCSFKTNAEMDIYEIYLIDKYRPQYNKKSVYEQDEISSIILPELVWEEYPFDLKEKRTMPDKKTAAGIEDIRAMINTLGGNLIDIRDRALILIGFAGAFRRSELVSIEMDDIKFSRDGLTITLRNSITDQESQGRKKGIPYGSNPDTCPVRALQDWLRVSNITQGAIFRKIYKNGQNCGQIHNKGLVDKSVALIIKKLAKAASIFSLYAILIKLRMGLLCRM